LIALLLAGCGSGVEPGDNRDLFPLGNLEPTTEIVNPQLAGDEASFNLLVSWKGYDEDGSIVGFQIAVDDTSSWHFTTAFESLFVFEAAACCLTDTIIRDTLSTPLPDSLIDTSFGFHTLFVRAVDNELLEDKSPDHISFTSTNLFPKTVIQRGPSQNRPNDQSAPTVILEWQGQDEDGEVAGYRYRLEDDGVWVDVGADCTSVRFTDLPTAQFIGDERGLHEFNVVSIDNAGALERFVEEPRNRRRWEALAEVSGTLQINSNVMGTRFGLTTIDGQVFQGTRVFFDWRGDASLYGGVILCYQFAFDQQEVFSACDLDNTHYPPDAQDFVPTIGSHTLFVNAFDDAGQTLRASFPFVVLRFPPDEKRIFYVDDFDNGDPPNAEFPDDLKEDAFWDSLLAGYPHQKFDAALQRDVPSVRQIGSSSTLIWYVDDSFTQLESANQPGESFENPMGPYVSAGGNLILCGNVVLDQLTPDNTFDPVDILNPGCIHDPKFTYNGSCDYCLQWFPAFCDTQLSFVYDFLKVSKSYNNSALGAPQKLKRLRSVDSTFVPSFSVDSTKAGVGPDSTLLLLSGLSGVESFDLRDIDVGDPDIVIPLWNYVNVDGVEGRVCGFYVPRSETTGRGHILILGSPPYYFNTLQMRDVFRTFLDRFGEQRDGG
jgi:hypothetical protein